MSATTRAPSRNKRTKASHAATSRDQILAALTAAGIPVRSSELARRLDVGDSDTSEFDAQLASLERDGFIMRNRKGELCVASKLDLVSGTVQGHADGFGFLIPDGGGDDLFIAAREMRKVLHGDRVTGKRIGFDRRGRPEGEIVDVLARANHEVVGRLHEERGIWFVEAENRKINQDLLIPPREVNGASAGQVVVAEILEQPSEHCEPIARIKQVLGSATDPGIEIEIALRKHDLPFEFSAAARRQAERLPPEVRPADRKGRVDLTTMPLVTIDGETAKDFDDAVYCEKTSNGFRLVVAIADVSHYVRDGDSLDLDARERGTSVYFPRRVIPMLPEALSNDLCSLKPDVDRLALVCEMTISNGGAIERYEFRNAIIHSHARLTYTQVWRWLSEPEKAKSPQAKALLSHLQNLNAVFRVLVATREARGAIDFDTDELALEFDEHGKIVRIVPAPRNDAHRMIEESMLAANVCAAEFLAMKGQAALYRVHEGPPPDKLASLREFLAGSALALGGGNKPTAADYAKLIQQTRDRPDFALLQTVLLRSLSQAQYRPENVGHFGLAYEAYMHFTSPIRRYPDLLTHRAIKSVLAGKHYTPSQLSWDALGLHCSMTERRADDASRDVLQWLKCHYMKDRIGEEFAGTITGVASFGIFVTLDGLNIDGLVHVTELGRDYFHFDAPRHALMGERSGRVFQLAGRIRVQVARVDLEVAKIDFTLAGESEQETTRERRPRIGEPLSRDSRGPRGNKRR